MDNGNIRDFIKNQSQKEEKSKQPQKTSAGTGATKKSGNSQDADARKSVENTARKYAGMNEAQLMNEMRKAAAQGKQNGELNAQSLEQFYAKAAPMLTVQQRNKLRSLINGLK